MLNIMVAFHCSHGNHQVFSCRGIEIAVDYFLKRGHTEVTAFVPQWRQRARGGGNQPMSDQPLLDVLNKRGHLNFTPARKIPGKGNVVCYDDKYVWMRVFWILVST